MKILKGKEQVYQDYLNKNDDGYGKTIFAYAERWAEMLESMIESSSESPLTVIVNNAESISFKADTEGITGFMYGCAVQMLSACWKYGEQLRQWHNKEYNYEGNGVVNPAVLTIR